MGCEVGLMMRSGFEADVVEPTFIHHCGRQVAYPDSWGFAL